MPTFRTIGGAEPSTITFSMDVVQIARNGSNVVREILVVGDPDSSNGNAAVLSSTPGSTAWGLTVRPLFSSTGTDNPVQISGNSTVVQGTSPWIIAGNSTVVVASGNSSVIITAGNSSVIIASGNSSVTVSNQVRVSNSTAADFLMRPVFSSTNTDNPVRAVLSSTNTDNPTSPFALASTGLSSQAAHAGQTRMVADVTGRPFVRTGHQVPAPQFWSVNASPGGSTFATVSKSSAAGLRQVVTGFTATVASRSTSPAAFHSTIVLIDGATAGTTFLWRSVVSLSSTPGGVVSFNFNNGWWPGAVAGQVTLEFQSSGDANTIQSVTMWGTSIIE